MKKSGEYKIPTDYIVMLCLCVSLVLLALVFDTPSRILENYFKINTSRSVLVTDYIALGGIGAALFNSAISGFLFLALLIFYRKEPEGKIIASLWTTLGFSLFGKNLFNTLPILTGIWFYARCTRTRFDELFVQAMLSATIAPLISEIAFLNPGFHPLRIIGAYGAGLFVGFIFPVVTEAAKRMHRGYCLYNCGTAGGFIATFCVGLLRSFGIEILPESIWDTRHTFFLASFAYTLAVVFIIYGLAGDGPGRALRKYRQLLNEKDKDDHDYLTKYGKTCYINIGAMCIVATSVMLLLRVPINGPVLGGIFTVAGFGASGKHLKSAVPILCGSIIATYLNHFDQATPANSLAMLFSTGLSPLAGKHGWQWGIVIGFMHVSVAIFIGQLNGGLNLYNNGFAGGFVAITIAPLIVFFKELLGEQESMQQA